VSALRRLLLVTGSIVVVLLINALSVAVGTALGLANFRDVGYADSAAVLIIDEFVRAISVLPPMIYCSYNLAPQTVVGDILMRALQGDVKEEQFR